MQHYEGFNLYIKERRLETGMSLNNFCYKNFLDPATISRYENNRRKISLSNLVKIAKAFDQTPSEFLADFESKFAK